MAAGEINASALPLRLGAFGLGRGFMLMLPAIEEDDRICLCAAATANPDKQRAFETQFGGRAYASLDAMCADPTIEAVYIATPHELHRDNVLTSLAAGKHVLVEKPMTIECADAQQIVNATMEYGRQVIVGPSHSFDLPIIEAGRLIASGRFGRVSMITAQYYTDFVFRPRRPEELDVAHGGGVVFNQGAHHIDVLQTLAGAAPTSVFGQVVDGDSRRSCDGAYNALIEFANGCVGSITYSGYGHYDSDVEQGWIGEMGTIKNREYAVARKRLGMVEDEVAAKQDRGFAGNGASATKPIHHEHFGNVMVSCEKADIRPTAKGIEIYGDEGFEFIDLPLRSSPRTPVIDELYAVVREGAPAVHSAARGYINVAACQGIYESARTRKPVLISGP